MLCEPAPPAPEPVRVSHGVADLPIFSDALDNAVPINCVRRGRWLVAFSVWMILPVHAQPLSSNSLEFAELEQSVSFDITSISGSLKETVQKGQQLIWRRKQSPAETVFRASNLAVALTRSQSAGQVMMSFSGSISSVGYKTSEEGKLHVIVRTKGGAVLHTSIVGIWFDCTDRIQTLHPAMHEIPPVIAATVFTYAGVVEISDHTEPNFSGLKIQRCGA